MRQSTSKGSAYSEHACLNTVLSKTADEHIAVELGLK